LNTYYTKCGREFKKSSTASVTGYKIDVADKECAACPFRNKIKKGCPEVFDHWECRAGSLPPNQKDDWRGSVDDKNSLHIRSLHNDFLESVLEYCKSQPDLSAAYNQDLDDCRRVISVSGSTNKKGMAAKKALVEKFFNGSGKEEVQEEPAKEKIDKLWATFVKCEACIHIIDEGDSVEYCKCTKKRGHVKREQTACDKFEGLEVKEVKEVNCNINECLLNDENGGCGFTENDSKNSLFKEYAEGAIKLGCKNEQLKEALNGQTELQKENEKVKKVNNQLCKNYGKGGDCHKQPDAPKWCFKTDEASCTYFKSQNEESTQIDAKTTENVNEIAEIDIKASEIVTFDYSTVDEETAEFLQNRANKITEIRFKSVIDIGKELRVVRDKLANNKTGTFGYWCESIGIKKDTAYRHINAYDYIVANCEDINFAESIQPSLLFAVSKPSAPKELQDQVLSGDITTHKQYKEKESEWKTKLDDARAQQDTLRTEKQQASIKAMDADRRASKLEVEAEELRDQLEELQNQKTEPQDTKTISDLQNRIIILENQLKAKPIETSAVQIVEKVPEKNAVETRDRLYGTLLAAKLITKQDVQIVCDTASYEKKMAICEFLENLRDMAPGYIAMLYGDVPVRKCEKCEFCSWDGLKEVDEEKGLILCTGTVSGEPQLIRNDSPCNKFKER